MNQLFSKFLHLYALLLSILVLALFTSSISTADTALTASTPPAPVVTPATPVPPVPPVPPTDSATSASDPKPLLLLTQECHEHTASELHLVDTVVYDNGFVVYVGNDPVRRMHNDHNQDEGTVNTSFYSVMLTPDELSKLLASAQYDKLFTMKTTYSSSDWPHYCVTAWKDGVRQTVVVGGTIYPEEMTEQNGQPVGGADPDVDLYTRMDEARTYIPAKILKTLDTLRYFENKGAMPCLPNTYAASFEALTEKISNTMTWPPAFPDVNLPTDNIKPGDAYNVPVDDKLYGLMAPSLKMDPPGTAYSINGNLWRVWMSAYYVLPNRDMWSDTP